ncbi:SDR family NAD(P)-dependent oxidoreductase [Roseitalea porphyridii]|uniref:SDR family oxidoreductase n=1 Tax=Roseitalea porphyridii TaxID=1852022 RepID=A0A4P6UXU4_9HYPH|nr:SDR family oxidoreductase [Roseitalea porphyridii]QBK29303.1 SDR family oxidoreductase [Roseitalea porphyridii]
MNEQTQPVALITGAARGIGLATARRFLAEGWHVAMIDRLGDLLVDESRTLETNRARAIVCDVSVPDQVSAAVAETIAWAGRIDALINNAGVAEFAPLLETSFETWTEVLATNLNGPFLMTQAAAPHMIAGGRGGSIVNVTSISGIRASTMRVAYGTSKAGLAHLTKQYAAELGDHGIRVNAVAPGPVETAMATKVHTPAIRQSYYDHMPLPRHAAESEIAGVIWFLCSPDAGFVTGQVIAADGGFAATGIGLPELASRTQD